MANKVKTVTLVATTVASVTFANPELAGVRVINETGTTAVYYTVDGTTPTVGGDDCYPVAAVAGADDRQRCPANVTVQLISSGTPTVTVELIN